MIIALSFFTAIGLAGLSAAPAMAISGGVDAPDGAYPFMVQIESRKDGSHPWEQGCGAALITPTTVITAAHCMPEAWGESWEYRLMFGRVNLEDPPALIVDESGIESVDLSSGWGKQSNRDAALIHLKHAVQDITPIDVAAPGDGPHVGSTARAIGWGWSGDQLPTWLQQIDLPVRDPIECGRPDTWQGICAGNGTSGTGPGDSGGPLFTIDANGQYLLVGLTASGTQGKPGSFTNLTDPALWDTFAS